MGGFSLKVAACGCKCAFVHVEQYKTVLMTVDGTDDCLLHGEKQLCG